MEARLYGGNYESITARFPGVPVGQVLLNKVFQVYGRGICTVQWFDGLGQPNCLPHPDNIRHQDVVVDDYVASCLQYGADGAVRGQPWAVLSKGEGCGQPPFLMVTWGTLCRAFYIAAQKEPGNIQIKTAIESGLKNVQKNI